MSTDVNNMAEAASSSSRKVLNSIVVFLYVIQIAAMIPLYLFTTSHLAKMMPGGNNG